ncbi:MAG: hypothetical protein D6740_08860 [Alphaproteobacteria bacterium]|nr:MAG: hypothetical protein D6740_08860 [Alphaproteobacteria bacterium]
MRREDLGIDDGTLLAHAPNMGRMEREGKGRRARIGFFVRGWWTHQKFPGGKFQNVHRHTQKAEASFDSRHNSFGKAGDLLLVLSPAEEHGLDMFKRQSARI